MLYKDININKYLSNKYKYNDIIIAFYINKGKEKSPEKWMGYYAYYLRKEGYITISLVTSSSQDCIINGIKENFIVNPDEIIFLERINIIILLDNDAIFSSPKTKLLAFCHALFRDLHFQFVAENMNYYDGLVIFYKEKSLDFGLSGYYPLGTRIRENKDFYIIPTCYPKVEIIKEKNFKYNSSNLDTIIYAPKYSVTSTTWSIEQRKAQDIAIIKNIILNFKNYDFFYRPYPNDLKSEHVKKILIYFSNYKNFHLSDSSDYVELYPRTLTMITDESSIVKTFSLATTRPSIMFQEYNKSENDKLIYETTFGYIIKDINLLTKKIKELDENKDGVREKFLKKINNDWITNEFTCKDLIKNIDNFLYNRPLPTWHIIEKTNNSNTWEIDEYINIIILSLPINAVITALGILKIKKDYIFKIISIHLFIKYYNIDHRLETKIDILGRIIKVFLSLSFYNQINLQDILTFYKEQKEIRKKTIDSLIDLLNNCDQTYFNLEEETIIFFEQLKYLSHKKYFSVLGSEILILLNSSSKMTNKIKACIDKIEFSNDKT